MPEVEMKDFRKGSQWFSLKRQHAVLVLSDNLYYTKFRNYCRPGMDGKNCYADEHYMPTFFNMVDPAGIANWSVTYVDWSEGKWHPRTFEAEDVRFEFLKNITSIEESSHVTSDAKKIVTKRPCIRNGARNPCYLFARKFHPKALDKLLNLFNNFTAI